LVLAAVAITAQAQEHSAPVAFNGHYYAVLKECQTWHQAKAYTEGLTFTDPATGQLLRGHLVTITSQEEQNFVASTFVAEEWTHAWIGAYRASEDGGVADGWAWVTCEPWGYTNWGAGQPQSLDEDHGSIMNYDFWRWHDYGDGYYECGYRYTIIEFENTVYPCPGDVPEYRCEGFEPPASEVTLVAHADRTIPLKMVLVNSRDAAITPDSISAPPVLSICRVLDDGSVERVPLAGQQFACINGRWRLDLMLRKLGLAPGTYRISPVSGNGDAYRISQPCELVLRLVVPPS
jgi:hypothetical protein